MSDRYSMLQSHRWSAVWWRKDQPDRQVAGHVVVDEEGIRLNGIGSGLSQRASSDGPIERFQIDGVISSGLVFSALECWQANDDFRFGPGPFEPLFHASKLYLGVQVSAPPRVSITYSDSPVLDPWLGVRLSQANFEMDSNDRYVGTTIRAGVTSRLTSAALPVSSGLEIWRNLRVHNSEDAPIGISVVESGEVVIRSSEPRELEEALTDHAWFHSLVELLTAETSPVEHMSFDVEPGRRGHLLSTIRKDFRRERLSRLHPGRFPFAWLGLERTQAFSPLANKWFADREVFRLPFALLREAQSATTVVEFKILAIAQALEGLHRRVFTGDSKYLDDSAYAPIRDAIVAAIPPSVSGSLRQALKKRLEFGNEASLRKRIKHLIDELPETLKPALGTHPRSWSDVFVEMRNGLTHLPEGFAGISDGRSAYHEVLRGVLVLYAHLLMALGLPADLVGNGMKRTHLWDNIMRAGLVSGTSR